jgi:rRNA maturation RNase YbeY
MAITFHHADVKFALKDKTALKKFIAQQIISYQNQPGTLTFVFCSDEYLLNINRQFLNHDYYTDIITFPLGDSQERLDGEIYISIDRVKENAKRYGGGKPKEKHAKSVTDGAYLVELQRVMFHGVLHLLGYKDKTKLQKSEMTKMEDLWLKQFKKFLAAQTFTPN